MTPYEQGFLCKCAEYGLPPRESGVLLKAGMSDKQKARRRAIGNTLIGGALSIPAFFITRGKLRSNKVKKLIRLGSVKTTAEADEIIRKHLEQSGKTLPKYRWTEVEPGKPLATGMNSDIPVYRDGSAFYDKAFEGAPKSVKRKVLRDTDGNQAFFDNVRTITMGVDGNINPKTLMHELGHAADFDSGRLNEFKPSGNGLEQISELWRGLWNPDSTKLLRREISAWDNAGIAKGDALREAALNTYRNHVRMGGMSNFVGAPALWGGIYFRHGTGRKD